MSTETPTPTTTTTTAPEGTHPPEQRFGQLVRLHASALRRYKEMHKAVWPEVLQTLRECNIRDYSIFYDDQSGILFATYKYVGADYRADMKKMSENEKVREWWDVTDRMQESPIVGAVNSKEGPGWWKGMEEVFFMKD